MPVSRVQSEKIPVLGQTQGGLKPCPTKQRLDKNGALEGLSKQDQGFYDQSKAWAAQIKPLLPMMALCFWFKNVRVTPSCADSVGAAEQNGYLYVSYLLASLWSVLQQHKYVAPVRAGGMTQQLCWCKRPQILPGLYPWVLGKARILC